MLDIKRILGNRVRELRLARGIKQEELAELAELDQRTISSIECGHSLSVATLENIIRALGVDFAEFLDFIIVEKTDEEIINEITAKLPKLNSNTLKVYYKILKALE